MESVKSESWAKVERTDDLIRSMLPGEAVGPACKQAVQEISIGRKGWRRENRSGQDVFAQDRLSSNVDKKAGSRGQ